MKMLQYCFTNCIKLQNISQQPQIYGNLLKSPVTLILPAAFPSSIVIL